ncbi:U11/U12 small nuclear ribonucleoprotein 35 kDa protein-like [Olea europaea var. sylvestris]|uniref:U11/U12 small nuclear ribonucleoprotein 35 kDa protein-like n=1 Tax=Olea europaea var. sylvestris TaxID=158386 RepID=UPI000C1D5EBC|nr:U11/U12 small nuclear ribonucleoprotein 35 kDa protein-like [Olea europaea var. sylvestris]
MSRFQIPSPPRRKGSSVDYEDSHKHEKRSVSVHQLEKSASPDRSIGGEKSVYREEYHYKHHKRGRHSHRHETKFSGLDTSSEERSYMDKEERSSKHSRNSRRRDRWNPNRDDSYSD